MKKGRVDNNNNNTFKFAPSRILSINAERASFFIIVDVVDSFSSINGGGAGMFDGIGGGGGGGGTLTDGNGGGGGALPGGGGGAAGFAIKKNPKKLTF